MDLNYDAHIFDYQFRWQRYLKECLSTDKSLRGLFIACSTDAPSIIFYHKDIFDFIGESYCVNSKFREEYYDRKFDYDIICRHFRSTNLKEEADDLKIRITDLENIKNVALAISKEKNKRVSIGFVYAKSSSEESLNGRINKYMLYSVSPDGEFLEEEVDMSRTCYRHSDFLGKLIYMHKQLVKKDKSVETGPAKKLVIN